MHPPPFVLLLCFLSLPIKNSIKKWKALVLTSHYGLRKILLIEVCWHFQVQIIPQKEISHDWQIREKHFRCHEWKEKGWRAGRLDLAAAQNDYILISVEPLETTQSLEKPPHTHTCTHTHNEPSYRSNEAYYYLQIRASAINVRTWGKEKTSHQQLINLCSGPLKKKKKPASYGSQVSWCGECESMSVQLHRQVTNRPLQLQGFNNLWSKVSFVALFPASTSSLWGLKIQ